MTITTEWKSCPSCAHRWEASPRAIGGPCPSCHETVAYRPDPAPSHRRFEATLTIRAESRELLLLMLDHLRAKLQRGDRACNAGGGDVDGVFIVEERP